MLKLTIPAVEQYDEINEIFIMSKEQTLQLEHSLVSISKWESKWCKPFLSTAEKTAEEVIDYIRCMTLTQNVDKNIYDLISDEYVDQISKYIDAPMTATSFQKSAKGINREIITSELIYQWMVELTIPFECEKWHLNRLITLINVCRIKNTPPTKMNKNDLISRNRALNESRRKAYNTKG